MNIQSILVNHMTEPLGFLLEHLRIEFTLEANHFEEIEKQLILSVADQPVYQTEFLPYDNNFFEVDLDLLPRTRYDIKITPISTIYIFPIYLFSSYFYLFFN